MSEVFKIAKSYKYQIETDTGVEFRDAGAWRSYELCACGNSLVELIEDATICEIDQDGGELNSYGIKDAASEVRLKAFSIIENHLRSK